MSKFLSVALFIASLCAADASVAQEALPALEADIVTTFALPQGTHTTLGRYFRSRDGKIREDSPLGSRITDARHGVVIMLNHITKEAVVLSFQVQHRSDAPAARFMPFDQIRLEGRIVQRSRATTGSGDDEELWTATEIGLVVFAKVGGARFAMTREIRNILLREPDAALFVVPEHYKVTPVPQRGREHDEPEKLPLLPTPSVRSHRQ